MTLESTCLFDINYNFDDNDSVDLAIQKYINILSFEELGESEYAILKSIGSKINRTNSIIEETYITEILGLLTRYFKVPRDTEPMTIKTQNELYLESKNDTQSLYSSISGLSGELDKRAIRAFSRFFTSITSYNCIIESNALGSVFPIIFRIMDDYQPENRHSGLKCAQHLISIFPPHLSCKFGIPSVIYESIITSFSFDNDLLLEKCYEVFFALLGKVETFGSPQFCRRADKLLLLSCSEIFLAREVNRKCIYLRGLAKLIEVMEITAIRYLKKILETLTELFKEFADGNVEAYSPLIQFAFEFLNSVIRNCWPRIDAPIIASINSDIISFYPEASIDTQKLLTSQNKLM